MKKLSIILPVYNEENFIATAIEKVIKADSRGLKKEIIIVDDGSSDATASKIKSKIAKVKNKNVSIKFIAKKKNEGKGAAVRDGFLKSTGDIAMVQDADMEYSPDDYPRLLEPFLAHQADIVYGSRFISDRPHRIIYFWHYLGNLFLTTLSNMFTNLNLTDMETGYKVFKGEIIRKIAKKLESNRFGFEPEVTARISKIKNIRIYEVGISYWGRTYAEGKKIGWKDGFPALWAIVKFNLFTK